MQLPIEEISNWLEYSSTGDGMENIVQIQKERFLEISFCLFTVQNARKMLEHLKTVYFKHFAICQYIVFDNIIADNIGKNSEPTKLKGKDERSDRMRGNPLYCLFYAIGYFG